MFTKADYMKYFDQLARVERKMIYRTLDLEREIADPSVKRVLQKIGDDEVRHYGYILKLVHQLEGSEEQGGRRKTREYGLGGVLLHAKTPAQKKRAYCVNMSETGICLEYENDYPLTGEWELAIRLFGNKETIHRRARFIWSKEAEPCFYVGGMEFTA